MKKLVYIFLFLYTPFFIDARRAIVKKPDVGAERFKDKEWLNRHAWFKIIPLQEILEKNTKVIYQKVLEAVPFDYPTFSISPNFPHRGYFHELFLLHIPHGKVQGEKGYVFIENQFPEEMVPGNRFELLANIKKIDDRNIQKISGKVAVIAHHGAAQNDANYYHRMFEVLGRLAILEMSGVDYDWLYVGKSKKFMQETLGLWGIDFEKIIEPYDESFCIQADELIVPSMVINTDVGHIHAGSFQHPITSAYVREKLLKAVLKEDINVSTLPKRIFVSSKDSFNSRRILNEDSIFELFAQKGFKRYELSKLSVVEQIILFNNADIVVSEQGSGLTNILFCKPETLVIELFQALIDNCFWWVSNVFLLQYIPVKTLPVDVDYFADYRNRNFAYMNRACTYQTNIDLDKIKQLIDIL